MAGINKKLSSSRSSRAEPSSATSVPSKCQQQFHSLILALLLVERAVWYLKLIFIMDICLGTWLSDVVDGDDGSGNRWLFLRWTCFHLSKLLVIYIGCSICLTISILGLWQKDLLRRGKGRGGMLVEWYMSVGINQFLDLLLSVEEL